MNIPNRIHRGAGEYTSWRLERLDLSLYEWAVYKGFTGSTCISEINGPEVFVAVAAVISGPETAFKVVHKDGGRLERLAMFDSVNEAIAFQEEFASGTVERIEIMESHNVATLMDGAL